MPTTRKKLDASQLAKSIVDMAVGDVPMPNPAKSRAGRKGGAIGGKKRMELLTDAEKLELSAKGVAGRKKAPAGKAGAGLVKD